MKNATEITPMTLDNGVELTRTRSENGTVTTVIPREHFESYSKTVFRQGVAAGKKLGIIK